MANFRTLTISQIYYLITLYLLGSGEKGIRCVDIAKALGISKPSVHMMMKTLSDMKLVDKTKYGNVFLSEKGKDILALYNEYYKIIRAYFEKILRLSNEHAKRDFIINNQLLLSYS